MKMSDSMGRGTVVPERDFSIEVLTSSDGYSMPYRLFIPRDYDCGVLYPVMIFLHGAGERGDDNTAQVRVALPHVFDDPESPAYNSIIIAPQCPENRQWVYTPWERGNYSVCDVTESRECQAVLEILRSVIRDYNVDRSRIYVTGLSMGGFGTWDLMMRHPSLFAAGMPVCGGGDPAAAKTLSEIPIRTFHGLLDGAVPTEGSREMYEAIRACGRGRIRYTEYENGYHDIWDTVYSDISNINWLYSNVRREVRQRAPGHRARRVGLAGLALGAVGAALLILRRRRK